MKQRELGIGTDGAEEMNGSYYQVNNFPELQILRTSAFMFVCAPMNIKKKDRCL